jgi:hypothetical protein
MIAEEVMAKVQVTVANPVDMVKDQVFMARALAAMVTAPTEETADPEEAGEIMPILYSLEVSAMMLEKEIFKTSSKGKDSVHQGSDFYRTKMENRRELPSSNSIMRMMLD